MSIFAGLIFIPEPPSAEIILPQFGSHPYSAVFTRFDLAIARDAFLASAKEAVFLTFTSTNFVAPSAFLTIILANDEVTKKRAS